MRHLFLILSLIIVLIPAIPLQAADLPLTGNLNGNYYAGGNILTQGTCTVPTGANVKCSTFYEITLNPGFETMANSTFYADINNQDDADKDSLPDWWELVYLGSLTYGANDDQNNNGLTNYQEYLLGSGLDVDDPDADADGDGFSNYLEFLAGSNPNNAGSKPKPGNYYEYDSLGRIKKIYKVK